MLWYTEPSRLRRSMVTSSHHTEDASRVSVVAYRPMSREKHRQFCTSLSCLSTLRSILSRSLSKFTYIGF